MTPTRKTDPADARAQRLREALRENLKRRKAQARGRQTPVEPSNLPAEADTRGETRGPREDDSD